MPSHSLFNVVLVEPEIPQNTGNIGRSCVALGACLHLVKPLGFAIEDRQLKRAGLDYWPHLDWRTHENLQTWQGQLELPERAFYFSTHATREFDQVRFQPGDSFVFGKETKGLPKDLISRNESQALTIPMSGPVRSLNLATAVAIVLFEAARQIRTQSLPQR